MYLYLAVYGLQKAFDSVQYPVFLKRLYDLGVNGKCWKVIKNWYEDATYRVKIDEVLPKGC